MRSHRIAAGFVLALTVGTLLAHGATNYWDNNGDTAGFGTAGGTWGIEQKWSADKTGASLPGATATTAEDDLNFGGHTNGLAAGTIAVDGTSQAFRSLTFGVASGPLTFSGGALNLGAPVTRITVNNASNTIGSVLAGPNSLFKFGSLTYNGYLTTNFATIFYNTSLAEYIGADGALGGFSIQNGFQQGKAYFFANNLTNATYQLQAYNGGYTKCVKVELTQEGTNVAARVLYAKYVNQPNINLVGYNFDTGGVANAVATSQGSAGYGAAQTTLSTLGTSRTFLPGQPSAPITIFSNATLAACVSAGGVMDGAWVAGSPIAASAYHFVNNGTNATYQLQALNDVYTKCVKVELTQAGPHIAARSLYAKYISGSQLGYNFDAGGTGGTIATSHVAGGYGAGETYLRIANDNTVLTLTGTNTYSGATIIANGSLALSGQGQLGGGTYAGSIINSGQLVCNSSSDQTLSGPLSSSGSLVKGAASSSASITNSAYLGLSAATVFTNATLATYRGASGYLGGLNINAAPRAANAFFFRSDGATATFQLQAIDDVYTKCVKVELTQAGADIAARVVYARYVSGSQLGFNFDSGATEYTIATSAGSLGYGAAQTTLTPYSTSRLTLSGNNSYAGGTVINSGILEAAASANALPSSGGVTVNGPGELRLNAGALAFNNGGGVGNGNPITVNSGGKLTLASNFNVGYSRAITLNGGVLSCIAGTVDNGENYLCNLTLLNGAQVTGNKLRIGYHSTGLITVNGTSPSTLAAGLCLVNGGGYPLTLNVSNVTGDAAADLTISGAIKDLAGLAGTPVIKTGSGTVTLSDTNTCLSRFTVLAGTLALGANNTLSAANTIVLSGGALAMGAYTNTLGTLTVVSNSVVTLGSGKLAFANSSAVAWTNSLTLVGTLDAQTLRFGTNDTALTLQQISSINLNGKPVRLRTDGYVSRFVWGTLISLQ